MASTSLYAFLQHELSTLSSESRRRFPDVKEAADKLLAMFKLHKNLVEADFISSIYASSWLIVCSLDSFQRHAATHGAGMPYAPAKDYDDCDILSAAAGEQACHQRRACHYIYA
jgi:hypothetical protein